MGREWQTNERPCFLAGTLERFTGGKGLEAGRTGGKTGISKSALASYENEENRNKEINHGNLIALADFMRCPLTICSAGQKTGSRSTPRCLNCT